MHHSNSLLRSSKGRYSQGSSSAGQFKRSSSSNNRCKHCLLFFALLVIGFLSLTFYSISDSSNNSSLRDSLFRSFRINNIIIPVINNGDPPVTPIKNEVVDQKETISDTRGNNENENKKIIVGKETNDDVSTEDILDTRPSKIRNRDVISRQYIHFIHIPKCGGTTMTIILRQMQCIRDPVKNADCCTNQGFCDWHAFRRCESIKGCTNHMPNRPAIFKPMASITLMREPIARILSAWFYRGHSPNLDFFQVRPYFKDISDGKLPRVEFPEYVGMHEYQNIQTRMLGADSFPYRNITVTDEVYKSAVEALNRIFFIGLQEEFEISSEIIVREFDLKMDVNVTKERDQSNEKIAAQKAALKADKKLMKKLRDVNHYDIALYKLGVKRFCEAVKRYPDLYEKVKARKKVKC